MDSPSQPSFELCAGENGVDESRRSEAHGIVGGKALMKRVPLVLITKVAALVMLTLGVWSLWEAVAG